MYKCFFVLFFFFIILSINLPVDFFMFELIPTSEKDRRHQLLGNYPPALRNLKR